RHFQERPFHALSPVGRIDGKALLTLNVQLSAGQFVRCQIDPEQLPDACSPTYPAQFILRTVVTYNRVTKRSRGPCGRERYLQVHHRITADVRQECNGPQEHRQRICPTQVGRNTCGDLRNFVPSHRRRQACCWRHELYEPTAG